MALNFDRIAAAVAAQSTVDASITTLLTNVVAALKDVSAKLADALAQNDPAAQAAVQAQLDGLATQIESQNSTLVEAVNANTQAQ
jgi:ABC-type Zn2+ transport system substrate-binding protein/surface adhesin